MGELRDRPAGDHPPGVAPVDDPARRAAGDVGGGGTDVEGTAFGDPAPANDLTPEDPAVRGT